MFLFLQKQFENLKQSIHIALISEKKGEELATSTLKSVVTIGKNTKQFYLGSSASGAFVLQIKPLSNRNASFGYDILFPH